METKTPKTDTRNMQRHSIISKHTRGNQSANIRKKLKRLMKRYKVSSEQQEEIIACQEDLKKKIHQEN